MAPPTDPGTPAEPDVVVTVVRSGGFAGLRREWTAAPAAHDAGHWIALIDDCPWDAAGSPVSAPGPDRFTWRIHAVCGPRDVEAVLPETDLRGPWQTLVDEVQAFPAVS